MANEEKIGLVIDASIRNTKEVKKELDEIQQKGEEITKAFSASAMENKSGSGGSGGTSSTGQNSHIEKFIDDFNKQYPKLKEYGDKFKGLLYGASQSEDRELRENFTKKGKAAATSFLEEFYKTKSAIIQDGKAAGLPDDVVQANAKVFSDTYGKDMEGAMSAATMDALKNNPATKQHVRSIGMYIFAGLLGGVASTVGNYMQSEMMVTASNQQTMGMGFNLSSLPSNYLAASQAGMQTRMRERELEKQKMQMQGGLLGGALLPTLLGLGALAIPGVGIPTAMMIGSSAALIGGPLGSEVGGYFGTKGVTGEMQKQLPEMKYNQLMSQLLPLAEQRAQVFEQFDVAKTKFGARFGSNGISGQGLGYSDTDLYNLGMQQGGITGNFNRSTFSDQMRFSRAHGYNPQDIFGASISTRYTGEESGASYLYGMQGVGKLTGMERRMPELIGAMNNLAVVMTKSGVNTSQEGLLTASMLPFGLYGNSARGRMGDLGMDTIMGMQGMFGTQTGSPQDIFMFNALQPLHKGNLMQFELLKQQGVFNPDVLSQTMKFMEGYGGSELGQYFTGTALGLAPDKAKQLTDQVFGFKKEGYKPGAEGWGAWLKDETAGLSDEETKQKIKELTQNAIDGTSATERHHSELINQMKDTGSQVVQQIWELQSSLEKILGSKLPDKAFWDLMSADMKKSFEELENLSTLLDEVKKERDAKNYDANIDDEKNFIYNLSRDKNDKLYQLAMDTTKLESNKGKFRFGDTMFDAEGDEFPVGIPYEYDAEGKAKRYMYIKNGYQLDPNNPNNTWNSGSPETFSDTAEEAALRKNTIDIMKQRENKTIEKPIKDGSQGNRFEMHFHINGESEIDNFFEEAKSAVKKKMGEMAKPAKFKIN